MNVPLLSVIVPVKDEEDAIAPFVARMSRVLDALAAPDGQPIAWEILFVDDGSTDRTMASILIAHEADARVQALSLSRKSLFPPADSSGQEIEMSKPPTQIVVIGAGHWRGEGMALVEAIG